MACLIDMKSVYLVGTAHRIQRRGACEKPADHPFHEMLDGLVERFKISGIGEEMSEEALSGRESVARDVAKMNGIPHRLCDPNRAERSVLGIGSHDPKRERYWLDQIIHFDVFPMLFILGAEHVMRFQSLLGDAGFDVVIVHEDWEP